MAIQVLKRRGTGFDVVNGRSICSHLFLQWLVAAVAVTPFFMNRAQLNTAILPCCCVCTHLLARRENRCTHSIILLCTTPSTYRILTPTHIFEVIILKKNHALDVYNSTLLMWTLHGPQYMQHIIITHIVTVRLHIYWNVHARMRRMTNIRHLRKKVNDFLLSI